MMKRYALLSALALAVVAAQAADFAVEGLYYNILDAASHMVEVSRPGLTTQYEGLTEVAIPAQVHYNDLDYTVVAVGKEAFARVNELKQVTLPATIQTIKESAFLRCASLQAVRVPAGVEKIEMMAFSRCSVLELVDLPASLAYMGSNVFYACSKLDTLVCRALTPPSCELITFPASVKNNTVLCVPEAALADYRSQNVWKTFQHIEKLTEPEVEDAYPCPNAEDGYCGKQLRWSLSPDNSVLTIEGTGAMYNYYLDDCVPWESVRGQIREVVLPAEITYIGHNAFFGCVQLEHINLPADVEIGTMAFGKCPLL